MFVTITLMTRLIDQVQLEAFNPPTVTIYVENGKNVDSKWGQREYLYHWSRVVQISDLLREKNVKQFQA